MKLFVPAKATAAALLAAAAMLSACTQTQGTAFNPSSAGTASAQSSAYQSSYAYRPGADPAQMQMQMANPFASTLAPNQTLGFGMHKMLTFTYQQQFDCVVQPFDDRNYSGQPAALDPSQFAMPECQVGAPSTISPTGYPVAKTDKLWVLVPFFETNKKTPAFTPSLGAALKKLFGFVPDAFKPNPGVAVQCPAPKDKPGTCTMHPLQQDLGPLLTALKLVPPKTTLYTPLVNHDHVLSNFTLNVNPEWWQIIVVLVSDPKAWPNAQGTTGIRSLSDLRTAQNNKRASADVPTNFFLFFSSKTMGSNSNMRM